MSSHARLMSHDALCLPLRSTNNQPDCVHYGHVDSSYVRAGRNLREVTEKLNALPERIAQMQRGPFEALLAAVSLTLPVCAHPFYLHEARIMFPLSTFWILTRQRLM